MKNLTFKILLTLLMIPSVFSGTPVEVVVPVDHIYTPKGFDLNDNVQVVVTGYLPNLCHKVPDVKLIKENENTLIETTSLEYDPSNPFCPQAITPYLKEVDLGTLKKGPQTIVANKNTQFEEKNAIIIKEASKGSIDQYVYLRVQSAERIEGTRTMVLKGYNPNPCMELDRIEIISNEKDTYSVLPIARKDQSFCITQMTPFTYEFEVPDTIHRDKVLLHIRSMSGNTINYLFYNNL